ncbi:TonB C-terminal domain-containing protein [Granulicella sibirica]|uniref:Hydroxyproline-rich glycoprotein DZ-HRGP n=1 Tax=Granulicella sibirica TaxID=2479048 RepID=A0A4V1L651_9BACT|nr:TonB C-terminal domain-containing protein [Granulicella sibirica]RXH58044.1 Hydroxyproline-rich glycoprotein DZ-HRGP precursor [Granulicella sibirica]
MNFRQPGKSIAMPMFLAAVAGFCGGVRMHGQAVQGDDVSRQAAQDAPWPSSAHGSTAGVEVLSDTQGVDFGPYIRQMLHTINDGWRKRLAQETGLPIDKPRVTVIRFSIRPDGTLASMRLEGTSHEGALDRAAWASMTEVNGFSALPATFTGQAFELRLRFNYLPAPKPNTP